jgi:hypothetical protein
VLSPIYGAAANAVLTNASERADTDRNEPGAALQESPAQRVIRIQTVTTRDGWRRTSSSSARSAQTYAFRAYTRRVPKTESTPMYPCMMARSDLRRVQQPHDERVVVTRSRLRRALAKLTGAARP